MKKYFLLSVIAILFSACASSQNYEKKLNQDIGKTSSQLINQYGNPSKVRRLNNGNEIISYISINQQVLPSPNYYLNNDFMTEDEMFYPFTYGGNEIPIGNFMGEVVTEYCKTDFYLKNNIVTSWQYKGNSCVSM